MSTKYSVRYVGSAALPLIDKEFDSFDDADAIREASGLLIHLHPTYYRAWIYRDATDADPAAKVQQGRFQVADLETKLTVVSR